jgi:hypothetical protein
MVPFHLHVQAQAATRATRTLTHRASVPSVGTSLESPFVYPCHEPAGRGSKATSQSQHGRTFQRPLPSFDP